VDLKTADLTTCLSRTRVTAPTPSARPMGCARCRKAFCHPSDYPQPVGKLAFEHHGTRVRQRCGAQCLTLTIWQQAWGGFWGGSQQMVGVHVHADTDVLREFELVQDAP